MGRKAVWTGDDLWRLLHLEYPELLRLYPEYNKNTLKGKRAFWKAKINRGEIEMPPRPEKEPNPTANQSTVEQVGENLVSTIEGFYEVVTKDAEGVAQVHRLYKHSTKTRPNAAQVFEPAQPARITPTKRKPIKRDYKLYVAMGDTQIDFRRLDDNTLEPLHDERAMKIARMMCADLQPDEIINLGDHVDMSSLSRFKPDSDHFHRTLGPSFQRAHDFYAELRADNPHAKIVEVSSNHEVRLRNWVLQNMPQMYGVKRPGEDEYPVMTYPYLTNLAHVGVEWIGGYGAAEYFIGGNEDLVARHGTETRTKTQSAANKIMNNYPETNNVHGHAHEMSMATRTLRNGRMLTSIAVGALCRTDGVVPSYHNAVDDRNMPVKRQENWSQGVAVIYDYGNSRYQFDQVPIINGQAFYLGKEYSGNE